MGKTPYINQRVAYAAGGTALRICRGSYCSQLRLLLCEAGISVWAIHRVRITQSWMESKRKAAFDSVAVSSEKRLMLGVLFLKEHKKGKKVYPFILNEIDLKFPVRASRHHESISLAQYRTNYDFLSPLWIMYRTLNESYHKFCSKDSDEVIERKLVRIACRAIMRSAITIWQTRSST